MPSVNLSQREESFIVSSRIVKSIGRHLIKNERSVRLPINFNNRKGFLENYGFGLIGLILVYILMTILRYIRDVVKEKGNVGLLFYLADFRGYLATVFILIYQNFGTKKFHG